MTQGIEVEAINFVANIPPEVNPYLASVHYLRQAIEVRLYTFDQKLPALTGSDGRKPLELRL